MRIATPIFAAAVMLAALSLRPMRTRQTDDPRTPYKVAALFIMVISTLTLNKMPRSCFSESNERPRRRAVATRLCSNTLSIYRHMFEECRREAIQRTVKQLGAPMVTRIYSESSPMLRLLQAATPSAVEPDSTVRGGVSTVRHYWPPTVPSAV